MNTKIVLISVYTILGLTACGQSSQPVDATASLEGANPAAIFCYEQGGQYDTTSGKCTLADGTVVNAWQYFREQHLAEKQVGKPNPAAVFCEEHGQYNLENGSCELEDGEIVDAWDYFRSQHQAQ